MKQFQYYETLSSKLILAWLKLIDLSHLFHNWYMFHNWFTSPRAYTISPATESPRKLMVTVHGVAASNMWELATPHT